MFEGRLVAYSILPQESDGGSKPIS